MIVNNKINKIGAFIIALLFVFVSFFSMFSGLSALEVLAADSTVVSSNNLSSSFLIKNSQSKEDDNYMFDSYSLTASETDTKFTKISLMLYLKNLRLKSLQTENQKQYEDYSTFDFTLYRVNNDGLTAAPVYALKLVYIANNILFYYKQLNFGVEICDFSPEQFDVGYNSPFKSNLILNEGYTYLGGRSYDELRFFLDEEDNSSLYLKFNIKVSSPFTSYFVRFEYDQNYYLRTDSSGWLWWYKKWKVYDTYSGVIDSPVISVYSYLKKLKDLGLYDTVFSSEQYSFLKDTADNILVPRYETIKIKYLERIPDTVFARPVYSSVIIPSDNNDFYSTDLASALGINSFDVLDSPCSETFSYDETEKIYKPHYLKNVWLSAKTTDGNLMNYFLDCNLSYYDYYYNFVQDNVFSYDLYEYIFSKILKSIPDTERCSDKELYGYFGYVVVPNTYTFDSAFAEMFDIGTKTSGVIKQFQYDELISFEAYNKLLSDYQYPWLARAWNSVAGLFTGGSWSASHYLFYTELVNEAFVNENGSNKQEDSDGAFLNTVQDKVTEISDNISEAWNNFINGWQDTKKRMGLIFGLIFAVIIISLIVTGINVIRRGLKKKD